MKDAARRMYKALIAFVALYILIAGLLAIVVLACYGFSDTEEIRSISLSRNHNFLAADRLSVLGDSREVTWAVALDSPSYHSRYVTTIQAILDEPLGWSAAGLTFKHTGSEA